MFDIRKSYIDCFDIKEELLHDFKFCELFSFKTSIAKEVDIFIQTIITVLKILNLSYYSNSLCTY